MNIKELKNKWSKEKENYKTQEVGSGVQKFVKDFLKSEDIFSLKEGLSSALLERRNKEFTEETKTKAKRLADVIIYINPEINIPLGIYYLTRMVVKMESFSLGLLAYNQGPGNVRRSMRGEIPFSKNYYLKVMKSYYELKKATQF